MSDIQVEKSRRFPSSGYLSYESLLGSYKGITTANWIAESPIISELKKELTDKQLFNKLKKELKEVANRTSAI